MVKIDLSQSLNFHQKVLTAALQRTPQGDGHEHLGDFNWSRRNGSEWMTFPFVDLGNRFHSQNRPPRCTYKYIDMYMICKCVQIFSILFKPVWHVHRLSSNTQTNDDWRTSRMQWEIVILVHSRRRSKKQQAVGPVGSRGSKLEKTTPTVKKFQGPRALQFLWNGWFKKAILLSVMECRNPYSFRMFVFVGLQLPRFVFEIFVWS